MIDMWRILGPQGIPPGLGMACRIILTICVPGIALFGMKRREKHADRTSPLDERQASDQRAREIQAIELSSDLSFLAKASRSNDPGIFLPARRRLETLVLQIDPTLERVDDDEVLAVIIEDLGAALPQLRRAAIARIGDQRVLARIIITMSPGEKGQLKAAKRITDPEIAAPLFDDLVRKLPIYEGPNADDVNLLSALIHNLSQSHLIDLVKRGMSARGMAAPIPAACLIEAVKLISDPEFLCRVCDEFAPRFSAGQTRSPICEAALAGIADQKLLLDAAAKIDMHGLGAGYLERIRDRITEEPLRARLEGLIRHKNEERSRWEREKS